MLNASQADKGGLNVGVIGIGGLGQMGVRLAKAMGNTVTAISTSPNKEAYAKYMHFLICLHFVMSVWMFVWGFVRRFAVLSAELSLVIGWGQL